MCICGCVCVCVYYKLSDATHIHTYIKEMFLFQIEKKKFIENNLPIKIKMLNLRFRMVVNFSFFFLFHSCLSATLLSIIVQSKSNYKRLYSMIFFFIIYFKSMFELKIIFLSSYSSLFGGFFFNKYIKGGY